MIFIMTRVDISWHANEEYIA